MITRIEPKREGETFYLEVVVVPEEHTLHADSSNILLRVIEMYLRQYKTDPPTDRLTILATKILSIGYLSLHFKCSQPMEVQVDIDANLTTVISGPDEAIDAAFQRTAMSDQLRSDVLKFVETNVKLVKS